MSAHTPHGHRVNARLYNKMALSIEFSHVRERKIKITYIDVTSKYPIKVSFNKFNPTVCEGSQKY